MIIAKMYKECRSLEKGSYKKFFEDVSYDLEGFKKLLEKIKVNDDITVFVDDDKLYCKIRFSKDFKDKNITVKKKTDILELELNDNIINEDLSEIYNGITDYVKYRVKEEWQKVLGKVVYLVKDRKMQQNIVNTENLYAFCLEDLSELVRGLKETGEIPQSVLLSCFFGNGI